MPDKMNIALPPLRALHRFGDIYEEAIATAESPLVRFTVDRASRDCIGPHWYGMRVHMECLQTGQRFYLHTGLIFLPETRTGLMVEVDKANNHIPYDQVWNKIESEAAFEVNREEDIYLKLFMPDADFAAMNQKEHKEQAQMLRRYITACGEGIAKAAYTEGFRLDYEDLANTLELARAFETALANAGGEEYRVEMNRADPDNFGQYASGFRYWLEDKRGGNRMYAYFGAIYSYKKDPAGVFAEIDWLNNQPMFQRAFENMKSTETFVFSDKEPKFIKLFFTPQLAQRFAEADKAGQQKILEEFLHECNTALTLAAR